MNPNQLLSISSTVYIPPSNPPSYEESQQRFGRASNTGAAQTTDRRADNSYDPKLAAIKFLESKGYNIAGSGQSFIIVKDHRVNTEVANEIVQHPQSALTHIELSMLAGDVIAFFPKDGGQNFKNQVESLLIEWMGCTYAQNRAKIKHGIPSDQSSLGKFSTLFGDDRLPLFEASQISQPYLVDFLRPKEESPSYCERYIVKNKDIWTQYSSDNLPSEGSYAAAMLNAVRQELAAKCGLQKHPPKIEFDHIKSFPDSEKHQLKPLSHQLQQIIAIDDSARLAMCIDEQHLNSVRDSAAKKGLHSKVEALVTPEGWIGNLRDQSFQKCNPIVNQELGKDKCREYRNIQSVPKKSDDDCLIQISEIIKTSNQCKDYKTKIISRYDSSRDLYFGNQLTKANYESSQQQMDGCDTKITVIPDDQCQAMLKEVLSEPSLRSGQPGYYCNRDLGTVSCYKPEIFVSEYDQAQCQLLKVTDPGLYKKHLPWYQSADLIGNALNVTGLGLTLGLNIAPRLIKEVHNWDESTKDPASKAALVARIATTLSMAGPPIMVLAGASTPVVTAASAVVATANGLESAIKAVSSTVSMLGKQWESYRAKDGDAAAFTKQNMKEDTSAVMGQYYYQALWQFAWATVHAMDFSEIDVNVMARFFLTATSFASTAMHLRRAYQNAGWGNDMLHQAMRGNFHATMAAANLSKCLTSDDEFEIIRSTKEQSIYGYQLGRPKLADEKEEELLSSWIGLILQKAGISAVVARTATNIVHRLYQWVFDDFEKNRSVLESITLESPDMGNWLKNLYEMRKLDKRCGQNARGIWNSNSVYRGVIAPIISILAIQRNPSPETSIEITQSSSPSAPAETQTLLSISEDIPMQDQPQYAHRAADQTVIDMVF